VRYGDPGEPIEIVIDRDRQIRLLNGGIRPHFGARSRLTFRMAVDAGVLVTRSSNCHDGRTIQILSSRRAEVSASLRITPNPCLQPLNIAEGVGLLS
jgi:hypothetical protein